MSRKKRGTCQTCGYIGELNDYGRLGKHDNSEWKRCDGYFLPAIVIEDDPADEESSGRKLLIDHENTASEVWNIGGQIVRIGYDRDNGSSMCNLSIFDGTRWNLFESAHSFDGDGVGYPELKEALFKILEDVKEAHRRLS